MVGMLRLIMADYGELHSQFLSFYGGKNMENQDQTVSNIGFPWKIGWKNGGIFITIFRQTT
jgi:hypothetical protein